MRILFMGTGDIAVPTFQWLLGSEHEVVALVTQPDRPVGRKQVLQAPAVKPLALEAGIPVEQPEKLRGEAVYEKLEAYGADVFVVMAYGQILTQRVIDMPKLACINLHASLLPKYRGASCIQSAIAAGDAETGISIMHVVKRLDAGPIILRKSIAIGADETGGELHDRLADLGPDCLEPALEAIAKGQAEGRPQEDSASTYAPKLGRADGEIDWNQSAEAIARLIRAYHPWPGTSTVFRDKKGRERKVKLFPPVSLVASGAEERSGQLAPGQWSAEQAGLIGCGEGYLRIEQVQPEGSRAMAVGDFIRGHLGTC